VVVDTHFHLRLTTGDHAGVESLEDNVTGGLAGASGAGGGGAFIDDKHTVSFEQLRQANHSVNLDLVSHSA